MPYGERALPHTCHTCLQRKYHAPSPDHPDRAEQFCGRHYTDGGTLEYYLEGQAFQTLPDRFKSPSSGTRSLPPMFSGTATCQGRCNTNVFSLEEWDWDNASSPFLMSRNHLQDNLRIFLGQVICFTPVAFDVPIREPLNSSKPCVLWPILAMVSQMPLAREHGSVAMSFQRFRNGHGVMVK